MTVILRAKVLQKRPVGIARDPWRKIARESMGEVGHYWFQNFFPEHFKEGAKYKYRHRPRQTAYKRNKVKLAQRGKVLMGGTVDNVFSGRTMQALLGNIAIVRPFPSRVTVYMRGPRYLATRFRTASNQPNKPKELTTVTRDEQRVLNRVARDAVAQRIRDYREQKITTP
jgi:hypothetical protein